MWGLVNGEFQGLSIDNIFDLNGAWSGLEWLGAYFTNTPAKSVRSVEQGSAEAGCGLFAMPLKSYFGAYPN